MQIPALTIILACWLAVGRSFAADEAPKISAAFPTNGLDYMGYPTNPVIALAKGEADARRDWSNGVFSLKTCGLPPLTRSFYEARLMKHCGVSLDPLAGCLVTEGLDQYIEGYNKFAGKQIKDKFGTNIFSRLHELAEADLKDSMNKAVREHKIQAGDTLLKIARQHGVTLKALQQANPDVESNWLKIGAVLKIPTEVQPKPPN